MGPGQRRWMATGHRSSQGWMEPPMRGRSSACGDRHQQAHVPAASPVAARVSGSSAPAAGGGCQRLLSAGCP